MKNIRYIFLLFIVLPLNGYCNYYQDDKIDILFSVLTKAFVNDHLTKEDLDSYNNENYSNNAELTQYRHEALFNIIYSDNIVLFFKVLKKHKHQIPKVIKEIKHPINDSFSISDCIQTISKRKAVNKKIKTVIFEGLEY